MTGSQNRTDAAQRHARRRLDRRDTETLRSDRASFPSARGVAREGRVSRFLNLVSCSKSDPAAPPPAVLATSTRMSPTAGSLALEGLV